MYFNIIEFSYVLSDALPHGHVLWFNVYTLKK